MILCQSPLVHTLRDALIFSVTSYYNVKNLILVHPMHPTVIMPMNCVRKMINENGKLYPPMKKARGLLKWWLVWLWHRYVIIFYKDEGEIQVKPTRKAPEAAQQKQCHGIFLDVPRKLMIAMGNTWSAASIRLCNWSSIAIPSVFVSLQLFHSFSGTRYHKYATLE